MPRRSSSLHSIDDLIQRNISNDKYQDVVTVGQNVDNIVPVGANIADVLAVSAQIIPNLAEILQVDDNAALVTQLYDLFDDRFLGAKDVAPTTDNDGDPLAAGAIYWDTVVDTLFVWDGTDWSSVVTLNTVQTLTNKTLDDISNNIGAEHIHYKVRNESGGVLTRGTVVTAQGTQSGTDYIEVIELTDPTTQIGLGILHTDLDDNGIGLCTNTGVCDDFTNTDAWDVGTILYPAVGGGLTDVKPTSGFYQACAIVTRKHQNQGTLLVEFSEPTRFSDTTVPGIVQLVDNLTTDDNTKALTAAQGKVVKDELDTFIATKAQPNGLASLDGSGLVPAAQLPSYVDDVIEVATYAALPVTGEGGKIYVVVADENFENDTSTYRWTGTIYSLIDNHLSAIDILNLIKTVDGSGSGLDADTLDSLDSTQFLRSDVDDTFNGNLTVTGGFNSKTLQYTKSKNLVADTDLNTIDGITNPSGFYDVNITTLTGTNAPATGWFYLEVQRHTSGNGYCKQILTSFGANPKQYIRTQSLGVWDAWQEIWNDGNAVITGNTITLTNDVSYKGFETDGVTQRALIRMNSSNQIQIGNNTSEVYINGTGGGVSIVGTTTVDGHEVHHAGNAPDGNYTPTATAVTNVDSVTTFLSEYIRLGNRVVWGGFLNIDSTSAGTLTEVRLSLPISSNFTSSSRLSGTISTANGNVGTCQADVTNNEMLIQVTPNSSVNLAFRFFCIYEIQ